MGLLLLIIAGSILATLIPQGKHALYYETAYGPAVARLIVSLSFDTFFRSFYFLFPMALLAMASSPAVPGAIWAEIAWGAY